MKESTQRIIGVDLAKRTMVVCIKDPAMAKDQLKTFKTDPRGKLGFQEMLKKTDIVGIEACALAFYLAREWRNNVGCTVHVLNPGKLQIIYKSTKKTDAEDARKIAWIMERHPPEELPLVSIPSEEESRSREMVSEMMYLKKLRVQMINRLHSVFVREGMTGIEKRHLKTCDARMAVVGRLKGRSSEEAGRLLASIDHMEAQILEVESELHKAIQDNPLTPILLSIPGVGLTTAGYFLAYVGNGERFDSGRQVSNYVGMTPRVDNSGETVRLGHITKRGNNALRSIIVQAAWGAIRLKESRFAKKYQELKIRRGAGRAIVAIARRMLQMMWLLVTRKEYYEGGDPEKLKAKLKFYKVPCVTENIPGVA